MKRPIFFKERVLYGIPLWRCPSFLFLVLGLFNIAAIISVYFIASRFEGEPQVAALIAMAVSAFILIISSVVVNSFDKLAQANKMKTEFIRVASHQLRTPLSAIRWSIDFLNNDSSSKISKEQEEYLDIIKESNNRMLDLINILLETTKIEMGGLKLALAPVDLKKIIQLQAEKIKPLASIQKVEIILDLADDLPLVFSDEEKIKTVISVLLDNAIKYISDRGEIRVKARRAGKFVQVEVKDSGVGIPKEQQKNIFDKFFRSDNLMHHQTAGSGLGLFIAKAIVEANKGKIWFESKENQGSSFYFRLPIIK